MLPGDRPFVAPSAVIQASQRLGSEAVRRVLYKQINSGIVPQRIRTGVVLPCWPWMAWSGERRILQRTMPLSLVRRMLESLGSITSVQVAKFSKPLRSSRCATV